MQNCKIDVKGKTLTITIDLAQRLGRSASGKTTLIATSGGNCPVVPTDPNIYIGINCYTKGQ